MKAKLLHRGPWQIPYKVVNCLCSDGKRRTARTADEPDTFFSIPARVQVHGKTVTGFVMQVDLRTRDKFGIEDGDIGFYQNKWQKNASALPAWEDFQGEQP